MEKLKSAIAPSNREAIAKALYQCVSETTVTTMLAQNYHWNVTGMAFGPLHNLFQEIYEDHFAAQDELAERIAEGPIVFTPDEEFLRRVAEREEEKKNQS